MIMSQSCCGAELSGRVLGMSWILDIIGAVGPGASGTALATAIYAGAVALNKDATPDAKHDISRFIRGFRDAFDVSLITRHLPQLFDRIYGKRHFSFRCVRRSLLTTFAFFSVTLTVAFTRRIDLIVGVVVQPPYSPASFLALPPWERWSAVVIVFYIMMCIFAIVPDYLALWKSRFLLHWSCHTRRVWVALLLCPIDALLSLILFTMCLNLTAFFIMGKSAAFIWEHDSTIPRDIVNGYRLFIGGTPDDVNDFLVPIFLTSTFLTSIWSLSVIVSAALIRLLATLQYPLRVLTWLLGADDNGIKIVGIMLGGLTWAAFIIYGFI
jgi:hypothetical protein